MGTLCIIIRGAALGACLVAGAAVAQTYPTALPVTGADSAALEERLAGLLEFSGVNKVTRFRLPSGRVASVRTYRPAQVTGRSGICRGYRIDLSGEGGFMAVDGFRCQEGGAWRIVEPETVLARGGNVSEGASVPDTPAEADEARRIVTGSVPVPRAAPLRPLPPSGEADLAAADPVLLTGDTDFADEEQSTWSEPRTPDADATGRDTDTPAHVRQLNERIARARRLEAEVAAAMNGGRAVGAPSSDDLAPDDANVASPLDDRDTSAPRPEESRAAQMDTEDAVVEPAVPEAPPPPAAARDTATEPAEGAAPDTPAEEEVAALPRERLLVARPARVVGGAPSPAMTGYGSDPRIVEALRDLNYLSQNRAPSASAVNMAVDEFANDERLALPLSNDALLAKLDDAVDRSLMLPDCEETPGPGAVCIGGP